MSAAARSPVQRATTRYIPQAVSVSPSISSRLWTTVVGRPSAKSGIAITLCVIRCSEYASVFRSG